MKFNSLYIRAAFIAPLLLSPALANAANFTVTSGQTVDTQTIGAGETGTVNSGGTISTTGATTDGIDVTGAAGIVLNNGNITTNGTNADGVYLNGAAGSTVTNNGDIHIILGGGAGVRISGDSDGSTVINNGSILADANTASGLNNLSDNSIVKNNGTITTLGNAAYGMVATGTDNVVSNNGTISTSGTNSHAMLSSAANNTLNNYGSITTANTISNGMRSTATNTTMKNYGTIVSAGPGMRTSSTDNILTNYGTITTTGTNSEGMASAGNDNTLTNNGTINVSTTNSDGMGSDGGTDGAILINNGIINASANATSGIANYSTNATVTNNGTINTSGASTIAIYNDQDSTVTLGANSVTNGSIDFATATNQLNYDVSTAGRAGSVATVSGGVNGTVTTSITGTASLTQGAQVVQSGDTVAVVTPDGFAGTNRVVNETVNYTQTILNQRQQAAMLAQNAGIAPNTQLAADTSTLNDAAPAAGWGMKQQNVAWAEGFGSYRERPEDGDSDFSRAKSGGVLTGVDFAKSSAGYNSGIYAGGFAGNLNIGKPTFRTIDSTGVLAGGYIGKEYGQYYVSAQVATGYSSNDSDRVVGVGIASADYDSYFISPSINVMRPYKDDGVTWVPSATIRYTGQHDGSYTETGSAANQSVDSQFSNTLGARAQVEAHLDDMTVGKGLLTPIFRAGVEGETAIGSNSTDLTVLGTSMSFDPSGADNNVDGILGVNLSYAIDQGPEIYLDTEASLGLNKGSIGDNFGGTGRVGARWAF